MTVSAEEGDQTVETFDFESFKKVFNLECEGDCSKDFNYLKFVEKFNERKT
jgi:hypothetical protein